MLSNSDEHAHPRLCRYVSRSIACTSSQKGQFSLPLFPPYRAMCCAGPFCTSQAHLGQAVHSNHIHLNPATLCSNSDWQQYLVCGGRQTLLPELYKSTATTKGRPPNQKCKLSTLALQIWRPGSCARVLINNNNNKNHYAFQLMMSAH